MLPEPRATNDTQDLRRMLVALEEMEGTLDRRAQRASGAMHVVWGATGALVFLFYHLTENNPEPYVHLLGPMLQWVWIAPVTIAYAVTVALGLRLGRSARPADAQRHRRHAAVLLAAALSTALLTADFLGITAYLIPGIWVAATAGLLILNGEASWNSPRRVVGALGIGTSLILLWTHDPTWAYLAAAIWFGAGVLGVGAHAYQRT